MHLERIRRAVISLAVLGIVATTAMTGWAKGGYVTEFEAVYGATGSSAASCALCHSGSSTSQWNAYGWDLRVGIQAGLSVTEAMMGNETANSDGDAAGSDNLAEILAGAQPGWTSGAVNTVHNKDGSTVANQTAPANIGTLDPAVVPPTPTPMPTPTPPPAGDGAALYAGFCAACHGADGSGGITNEDVQGTSAMDILDAIDEEADMQFLGVVLTPDEILAISDFLAMESGDSDGDKDKDKDKDKDEDKDEDKKKDEKKDEKHKD